MRVANQLRLIACSKLRLYRDIRLACYLSATLPYITAVEYGDLKAQHYSIVSLSPGLVFNFSGKSYPLVPVNLDSLDSLASPPKSHNRASYTLTSSSRGIPCTDHIFHNINASGPMRCKSLVRMHGIAS